MVNIVLGQHPTTMRSTPLILVLLLTTSSAHRAVHYADYNDDIIFRRKVNSALAKVQSLLEHAKSPRRILLPADVDHKYDDKFLLAEFITNLAVAATSNALDRLGIKSDILLQLKTGDELEHIKPLFRGGATAEGNLLSPCKTCHLMKSALEQSSR